MKQIVVSKEIRSYLIQYFDVSRETVWAALNYKKHSSLSIAIRSLALKKGGVKVDIQ